MSRRAGSSLVEVLIALGVLVGGLLVAYILLQNSFLGFRRLDRRQTAEAISLNIQDRYFHTSSHELMEHFGGPAGGRRDLEADELVRSTLPISLEDLHRLGFELDAYAVGLDQGNGSTGLYFTTKVSWPVSGGARQYVTHSRVVGSGLRVAEIGPGTPDAPATAPPAEQGKLLPLAVAGNVEAFGPRAAAVEAALAGQGRSAAIVFEGNAKVLDQMGAPASAAGDVSASGGGSADGADGSAGARGETANAARGGGGASGGADSAAAQAAGLAGGGGWGGGGGAASASGGGAGGGAGGAAGPGGGFGGGHRSVRASETTSDWDETSGEVVTAHGSVPGGGGRLDAAVLSGGQSGETGGAGRRELARGGRAAVAGAGVAAAGGDATRSARGEGVTPDPMEFLRAAAPQLSPEERKRLVPGKATTEEELAKLWGPLEARRVPPGIYRYTAVGYLHVTATKVFRYEVLTLQSDEGGETYPLLSRRELTGGQVSGAYLEGAPVLERQLLTGTGGVSVIYERCGERMYLTRPVVLPDGTVAPFGREIAVMAWDGAEDGASAGTQGKKAFADIARRWGLGAAAKQAPAAADAVAASYAGGQYQEKIQTPRAGPAVIETIAVNWASTRSRDGKAPAADPDGAAWRSSGRYREAVELINQGATSRALELVEAMRKETGTPPADLERLYGSLLLQLDRFDDAAQIYGGLSSRPEATAADHNNLAFLEIHRKNYAGALSAANAALASDPNHLTAYVNAGIANEFLGKREEAIAAYRRGLEHHPGAHSLTEGLRRMGGM